jgi:putative Holliday junction resolvase
MRTMGLDVGTKTVGIAVSDALGITAQGLTTLRRTNLKSDLAEMKRLVAEHEVTRLVVGLPLNMDGSEGPRAQSTRAFARNLARETELPIALWDERWSTAAVERELIGADVSRAKRAAVVDQHAAAFILQGALDRLTRLQREDTR